MATNNSASHIAALKAFNAINKKKEEPQPKANYKPKIPLQVDTTSQKLPANSEYKARYNQKQLINQAERVNEQKDENTASRSTPTTPNSTNISKTNSTPRTPQYKTSEAQNSVRAAKRASTCNNSFAFDSSAVSNDQFGQPLSSPSNIGRRKTISQQSLNQTPQEMIENVKKSISQYAISDQASQASSKRLSTGTQPKEMLDKVRNSINSKAKNNTKSTELSEKNAILLSEIRGSIDLKRISSNYDDSTMSLPLSDERSNIINLISKSNNPEEQRLLYGKPIYSYSSSSFGSSFLENDNDQLRTPVIIRTDMDLPDPDGSASIQLHDRDNRSNGDAESNISDSKLEEKEVYPINIPLSLHACARLGIDSSEGIPKNFINLKVKTPEREDHMKLKPRRKPPPDLDIESTSPSFAELSDGYHTDGDDRLSETSSSRTRKGSGQFDYGSSSDTSSRSHLKLNDDSDYSYFDESDLSGSESPGGEKLENTRLLSDDRLPIFPDIKTKPRMLFRNRKSSKLVYMLEDTEFSKSDLTSATDNNYLSTPSRSSTPVTHQLQPVQLKTTMRTGKKREKKYSFNENKPWKNHSKLSYVTEQERKRYEGLWVSNKGLYINCAVTKFKGIDYDGKSDSELPTDNQDAPTTAALLSARTTNEDNTNAVHENFHGLLYTETSQLIHGVVVKRIWKRSRLPKQTLEAIWNLVDFRKDGTLNKPEFLVGMWLVDQCLYGRKLPKKVDSTVWNSLGNVGLNVVLKKKGKR